MLNAKPCGQFQIYGNIYGPTAHQRYHNVTKSPTRQLSVSYTKNDARNKILKFFNIFAKKFILHVDLGYLKILTFSLPHRFYIFSNNAIKYNLRPIPHNFLLPPKDDSSFISRILFRKSLGKE